MPFYAPAMAFFLPNSVLQEDENRRKTGKIKSCKNAIHLKNLGIFVKPWTLLWLACPCAWWGCSFNAAPLCCIFHGIFQHVCIWEDCPTHSVILPQIIVRIGDTSTLSSCTAAPGSVPSCVVENKHRHAVRGSVHSSYIAVW